MAGPHSDKWYQREPQRTVTLAGAVPHSGSRPAFNDGVALVRRKDITPAMEAQVRMVASVFPGTRIFVDGMLRPIRVGIGS